MDLGCFSISLAVKDLEASIAFYRKLGFEEFGDGGDNWRIMKNGDTNIGLFQGMFDKNIMAFNPGWDQSAQPTESFQDIRSIAEELRKAGVNITSDNTGDSTEGPAHLICEDPDGNTIMLDQHR